MARTTYAAQKFLYPNASDADINALISVQDLQEQAYNSKNYDQLNRLYNQEIEISTRLGQSAPSKIPGPTPLTEQERKFLGSSGTANTTPAPTSTPTPTPSSTTSSYVQALQNQAVKNQTVAPVAPKNTPTTNTNQTSQASFQQQQRAIKSLFGSPNAYYSPGAQISVGGRVFYNSPQKGFIEVTPAKNTKSQASTTTTQNKAAAAAAAAKAAKDKLTQSQTGTQSSSQSDTQVAAVYGANAPKQDPMDKLLQDIKKAGESYQGPTGPGINPRGGRGMGDVWGGPPVQGV